MKIYGFPEEFPLSQPIELAIEVRRKASNASGALLQMRSSPLVMTQNQFTMGPGPGVRWSGGQAAPFLALFLGG